MTLKELDNYFLNNDESQRDKVIKELKHVVHADMKGLINQLYSIYEKVLIKENNIDKEIFFIQVLTLISDRMIQYDSLAVFVKRYIKCFVDSAGFDLRLCSLSRQFILSLAKNKSQSEFILSYLIDVFVGKIHISNEKPEEHQGQVYEERQRFIRSNCENLIIDVINLSDVKIFFEKIDEHITLKDERLRSLDLLSSVLLKCSNSNFQIIANTGLLKNLMNCLLYDESIVELNSASTSLTLILPHIVAKPHLELSKLFLIYARLVSLTLDADDDYTPEFESNNPLDELHWEKLSNFDEEDLIELDYFRLFAFLYGLYPLNLVNFFQDSNHYFKQLDENILNILLKSNKYDFFEVKAISEQFFEEMSFHKNFLVYKSADEELNDTLRWKKIGDHTDIANMCLGYLIKKADLKAQKSSEESETPLKLTQLMETHKELYTTRKSVSSIDSGEEASKSGALSGLSYPSSTSLEFYRRELLLIRNDLKFTTYLKDLNEAKLNDVLKLYKNEVKNHKLAESSMLNLRILNNKNQLLTKNIDQLKEEYKRFKNDRLKYEVLILGKNKALRKVNDENKIEIKNLQSANEELKADLESLKESNLPKDIEINDLKLSLSSLRDEITELNKKLDKTKHTEKATFGANDLTVPYSPTSVANIYDEK